MNKTDIKSMTFDELAVWAASSGLERYRSEQIYRWMHVKMADSIDGMTNISLSMREKMKSECEMAVLRVVDMKESARDGTRKYLFALNDGNVVESVLMRYKHGDSVCISSQAGCRMGCLFCASSIGGLKRNLTAAEMLDQVYRICSDIGQRVSNVVVMGIGEPLDNLDNLLRFIEILTDKNGLNISQRNITVSTCGIVPKIYELAQKKLQITLAVSLHAAVQEIRIRLMPIAAVYDIDELIAACEYYFEVTGRRVTYEYSLIAGINDSAEDARDISRRLNGQNVHINLIPLNPLAEKKFAPPAKEQVRDFKNMLEKYGINVTIRKETGRDIDGACGQLRRHFTERQEL